MTSGAAPRITSRRWLAVGAELSPLAVGLLSVLALWAVASYVPDGKIADRLDYTFWTIGAFGLGACGLGWLLAGRRLVAVALFATRSILIASGATLLDLGLTIVCDSPCGPSWAVRHAGLLLTSGLLLSAVSFGMPLASAVRLLTALSPHSESSREQVNA